MNQIKQLHAHSLRRGIDNTHSLILNLLSSAAADLAYARALLFSSPAPPPTTFLCNKLLQSYSLRSFPFHHSLSLFSIMHSLRYPPLNLRSFTFFFSACASFSCTTAGAAAHNLLLKLGFSMDAFVLTSLIGMYCKCHLLDDARKVFDEIPVADVACWNCMIAGYARSGDLDEARKLFELMHVRNVISWTSMVSGYSQNERYEEAIELFMQMSDKNEVKPNAVTLASVLPACANVGALDLGQKLEFFARENGLFRNLFVSNALLEMYAKCGEIEQAKRVFDEINDSRNVCSWNSMIMGLAVHGRWKEALDLFDEMRVKGSHPDDITFVGVLMACTHGGLVDQGRYFFRCIEKEFSLSPKLEHYGCMVDLLGRAGLLHEAYRLINSMPMKPDAVIWGALLGACSFHGDAELAEIAAKFLAELEPWNTGNHVLLSNIYASSRKWDCVAREWKLIKVKQQKKAAGYSLIELNGSIHKFLVEDKSHPRFTEIYRLLHDVTVAMKPLEHEVDLLSHNLIP